MSPPPPAFIPYGRQVITDDDLAAVAAALRSDWLTTGPRVAEFESVVAAACGARYAVAVANGTAALHVAMLAAGIGPGDRVLTSAITFLASANAAEFVGATADFADIDPATINVTAATLREAWRDDVRAVVPVDFGGRPCDLPGIAALARARGAVVIADACHSIGGQFAQEGCAYHIGGHPWADMTCLSFHPVKTVTTGEGGVIATNDARLAERCRHIRSHGMLRESADWQGLGEAPPAFAEQGPWYYEMAELGYNYRITDLQCALGTSQMRRLQAFVARRQAITDRYNTAFSRLHNVATPPVAVSATPAWHLYVLQCDFAALGRTRTQVMQALSARGVGTQVHYIPVHLQPYYRRKYGYAFGKCPSAEAYYPRCLSLPLAAAMNDDEVDRVIAAVQAVFAT